MKYWAIYTRVSTEEQHTDNQIRILTDYAKRLNLSYVIVEEIESTRKTRPLKQKLLNQLRQKQYEGVLVYKLDRWARSSRELLLEIEELISKGVKFVSYSENIDFTTAIGKLQFNILSAFAEFERNLISQRTKDGLKRVKASGTQLGRRKGSTDKKKRKTIGYYDNKNAKSKK
jgi:DNA invertase Pin-like site-specific DNA recombinase